MLRGARSFVYLRDMPSVAVRRTPCAASASLTFACILKDCQLNDSGKIEIDFATAADLPRLADMLAELFTLERDFHPDRDKQLRGLRLILDNPALGRLFVLRDEAHVLGMANALITVSTAEGGRVLLLEDVIVRREYRGRGFGQMLAEHVLAWATMEGLTRVTLLADRDNAAALDFYHKLGFADSQMTVLRYIMNPSTMRRE